MIIKGIHLNNFRKFEDDKFLFKTGINLVTGLNGSGKSTLLNSIAYAIYGEPSLGTNLRDNLRYSHNGRANSAFVELETGDSIVISRKIKLSGSIASQITEINNKQTTVSDLSKIQKNLPNKELFYELIFVDNLRQDLADINEKRFRELLSVYRLDWNRQIVSDNTKSFSVYLKSRQSMLREMLEKTEGSIEEINTINKNIVQLEIEQSHLSSALEERQKKLAELEDERISEEIRQLQRSKSISELEHTIKDSDQFVNRIKYLAKEQEILDYFVDVNRSSEYQCQITTLLDKALTFEEFLEEIIESERNAQTKRAMNRGKLSQLLDVERRNIAIEISKLEKVSHDLNLKAAILREEAKIKSQFNNYSIELEKYRKKIVVADKINELIDRVMDSAVTLSLDRITKSANKYLQIIDVPINLIVYNKEIAVQFEKSEVVTDIDALSAGERSILNMLIRIATLQELGLTDILILEDPIVCLDELRIKKFLTFLYYIKQVFSQIIIGTIRDDIFYDKEIANHIKLEWKGMS